MRRLASLASLTAVLAFCVADRAVAQVPGPIDVPTHGGDHLANGWKPELGHARRYARGRTGDVRFAITDLRGRVHSFNGARTAPMASLFKAMELAAYLSRPGVRTRGLHGWERDLLGPMIRRSDNAAATRVRDMLGAGPIAALSREAHMRDFSYNPVWGLSRTSARDQASFFARWDRFVPKRHRRYARSLLSSIVPAQRWGIARARPKGWRIYFKGGWGVGSGRVNHQTAFVERGRCRVGISVMTEYMPSHGYGTATQRGVAQRLFRGIRAARCGSRVGHGGANAELLAAR